MIIAKPQTSVPVDDRSPVTYFPPLPREFKEWIWNGILDSENKAAPGGARDFTIWKPSSNAIFFSVDNEWSADAEARCLKLVADVKAVSSQVADILQEHFRTSSWFPGRGRLAREQADIVRKAYETEIRKISSALSPGPLDRGLHMFDLRRSIQVAYEKHPELLRESRVTLDGTAAGLLESLSNHLDTFVSELKKATQAKLPLATRAVRMDEALQNLHDNIREAFEVPARAKLILWEDTQARLDVAAEKWKTLITLSAGKTTAEARRVMLTLHDESRDRYWCGVVTIPPGEDRIIFDTSKLSLAAPQQLKLIRTEVIPFGKPIRATSREIHLNKGDILLEPNPDAQFEQKLVPCGAGPWGRLLASDGVKQSKICPKFPHVL